MDQTNPLHDEVNPEADSRALGYPPALAKACYDYFDYACRLRTGEVLRFCEAEPISFDWVHLREVTSAHPIATDGGSATFDRGLDVRVSDIVWVADAPHGS